MLDAVAAGVAARRLRQPARADVAEGDGGRFGGRRFLQARQAQLRLRLYAVVQGGMQTIAERRYRVSGLPLRYAFDLEVDRLEGEALYLRTELSWVGVAAVRRAPGSGWRRASMSGSGWFGATVFRIVRPLARKKDLATIDTLPAVSESAYGD